MMYHVRKWFWFTVFVATVYGANWSLDKWGFVSIGFGQVAPAGVYVAGLAFTARDQLREASGRNLSLVAVAVGAVVSWWLEDIPRIALASGVAFVVSETADTFVYEPLRHKWATAVLASNAVGLAVDSALFLWIAFGSIAHVQGLIVGKVLMTLVAVGSLAAWREWRR